MSAGCVSKNRRGLPCRAPVLEGCDRCYWHHPGKAAERKAAQSRGGRARHGRRMGAGTSGPVEIKNVADVIRVLTMAINDARDLETSVQRARTLGYLAGVALRAVEVGGLEERVAALEAMLRRRPAGDAQFGIRSVRHGDKIEDPDDGKELELAGLVA